MTPKEKLFVDAYIELNLDGVRDAAGKAAEIAGYTPRHGHFLLNYPRIQADLERRRDKVAKKYDITPERTIAEIGKLAFEDLTPFMKVDDQGSLYWDFTGATEEQLKIVTELQTETELVNDGEGVAASVRKFKVKRTDKLNALDKLMRHFGQYNDKLDVQGEMTMVERLQAGRKRVKQKKSEKATGDGGV